MRLLPRNNRYVLTSSVITFGLGLLAGCPQAARTASFTAGSGSEFGTIVDGKGNASQINQIGDGFGVAANGEASNAVHEVDGQGRLTHLETDRVMADFVYNADGSTSVSGSLTVVDETRTFDGTVPADISTAKARKRSQGQGSVRGAVDFFCTNLDAVLLFVEGALLRDGGVQDNPDNDFLIYLSNGAIELAVSKAMERITGPAQAFCAAWPEIRGELGNMCD